MNGNGVPNEAGGAGRQEAPQVLPPDSEPQQRPHQGKTGEAGTKGLGHAIIVIAGFLTAVGFLAGVSVGVWMKYYREGLRNPHDNPGNLILLGAFLVFALILVRFVQVLGLARAQKPWGGASRLFLILLPIYFLCLGVGANTYGGIMGFTKMSGERAVLRVIATALNSYAADWGAYPPRLQTLTQSFTFSPPLALSNGKKVDHLAPYVTSIPHSAFAPGVPPRYFALPQGHAYLVWLPGPDQRYDITEGNDLAEALGKSPFGGEKRGPVPPPLALANKAYDPTNGLSGGDIMLWRK